MTNRYHMADMNKPPLPEYDDGVQTPIISQIQFGSKISEPGFGDSEALLSEAADAWLVDDAPQKEDDSSAMFKKIKFSQLRQVKHTQPKVIIGDVGKRQKLDFDSIGLINRESEVALLKSCFRRMLGKENKEEEEKSSGEAIVQKEFILLSGLSGVGKSSVVQTLEAEVLSQKGIFVKGKFTSNDKPYSGIAKAFGMICERIDQMSVDLQQKIATKVSEEFGSVQVLMHLFRNSSTLSRRRIMKLAPFRPRRRIMIL